MQSCEKMEIIQWTNSNKGAVLTGGLAEDLEIKELESPLLFSETVGRGISSHDRRPGLLVPLDPTTEPLDRLLDTGPGKRTAR
jgi:hypothetical protein